MSSRENGRATGANSFDGIVRRMVNLPLSILGGVSRVMDQSMDLMGMGRRSRNRYQHSNFQWQQHPPGFPLPHPPSFHLQHPQEHLMIQEEWVFLSTFEQQYGTTHPFFYACHFLEALKMAKDEHKFLFVYLHLPEHPFTPQFCTETLSCELVIQFLDANFISWGGLANRGEGLQMVSTLRASAFPFCALVAPSASDSIAVLQQIEGPVSPAELVEILQRTLEEQGVAFGSGRAREEDRRRVDRRLREEQDAAYLTALQIDQEREKLKKQTPEGIPQKEVETLNKLHKRKPKQNPMKKELIELKEASHSRDSQHKDIASRGKDAQVTQVLIRFPNGERREQSFLSTDMVQAIYRYIDSLSLPGIENYRLVSSFPRKVFGVDQMGMTLKDAGIHPKVSIFLELF